MKRSVRIYTLLLILIICASCTLFGFEPRHSFFSPTNWENINAHTGSQDCETLSVRLDEAPSVVHVTVDGEEFSCIWRETQGAQFCEGPSSSLDPELTVKIYAGKGNQEPKKIITIPNQRPLDICDYDGDGAMDAEDSCPADPDIKICACEVGDGDLDGDGLPDCVDQCPNDSEKDEPGLCGCGIGDTDQDGMPDCLDECPEDPTKEAPEYCGCGVAETDTDGDYLPDCVDSCPDDPNKDTPGVCGCGLSDLDEDGDGLLPCQDPCPGDAWHDDIGDACDHDEDNDGSVDSVDGCPFDPKKTSPGICGCGKTEISCQ